MRLLPRSLLWRTFAVISLALIAAIGIGIGLLQLYEREPRAHTVAQQIAAIVNLTRAALVSSRPEARGFLMREIAATEQVEIYPAEAGETLEAWPVTPLARRVAELARLELARDQSGDVTRFASTRNGAAGLWVSFRIDDDEYWVRMNRERIEQPFPWDWVVWGLIGVLLTLLGTWVVVVRITQPLRALADAAQEVGRGLTPAPLPGHSTREITDVANAFNQMTQDLKRQEENRALVLAGISHDLRTPLARLRLGVEMSGDSGLRDGMVADIEQTDQVIGQFLDFARSGRDDSTLTETELDLSELAHELHTHYTSLGHHVTLDAPVPVYANLRPAALKRAVINLIENALRYGGAHPEIGLRVAPTNGFEVIEVSDRGPGIPLDQAERLKQPFTRFDAARGSADGTVEGQQGGSGLGLAIVDRIVRQHGGSFDLLPRDGGGLTARITLPPQRPLPHHNPHSPSKEPA